MRNLTKFKGFTLAELMITVAIVGILSAVAYPSYTSYVSKSNRGESQRELAKIAALQEQYFIDHRTYSDDLELLGFSADPYITSSGNYSISSVIGSFGGVAGVTFTLTATAKNTQLSQDTDCTWLSINENGQKSAESAICWGN
jgi:type IV pilus assembly protein PilE